MAHTIAVAGKGGTGKTTTAALIVTHLLQEQQGPLLAVDADPNTNLNEWLGLDIEYTLGDVREEALRQKYNLPAGMDKHRYLEYQLQMCLVEGKGLDLIAMGRAEGPDCYCYVNNILRSVLDMLQQNYRYVVMDNEAGMEHLSRQTTRDVDQLLIVSDPSVIGVRSAGRIYQLAKLLELTIGEAYLVINRVRSEEPLPSALAAEIEETGLPVLGRLPYDPQIVEFELDRKPLHLLPADSPVREGIRKLLDQLLMSKGA